MRFARIWREPGMFRPARAWLAAGIILTLGVVLAGGWAAWQVGGPSSTPAPPRLKLPFAAGPTWVIASGYGAAGGGDGTGAYSLSFTRADGQTADEQVLAPASGTIRWLNPANGSLAIDLGDGSVIGVATAALDPALTPGQSVRQGQPIGTTTKPTVARDAQTPRIALTLWRIDGTRLEGIPFTGPHALDGQDLPERDANERDQYHGRAVVSSNEPAGPAGPLAPALKGPAAGFRIAAMRARVTLSWNPVPDATAYRVEINGAAVSPWLVTAIWTTGDLNAGAYSWRVRARGEGGTGPLSPPWTFAIDATPSRQAAGPVGLRSDVTEAETGATAHLTGAGFAPGEQVTLSWAGQPMATLPAGASGAFATDVTVPEGPGGEHAVAARGETSGRTATATITVRPSLARGPSSAPPGSPIAIAGRGFAANETVRLTWHTADGPRLATLTTDAQGSGTATVTLPDGKPGWNDYAGAGEKSKARAWGAVEIQSRLALSPDHAQPGDKIDLSGRGLPPGKPVAIAWNKTAGEPGTLICHGTTDAGGRYACTFPAPRTGAGTYPVVLTGANELSVAGALNVRGPAAVAITPGATAVGTNVTLALGGFAPRETVSLTLGDQPWRTVKVDASGALSLPTTVPPRGQGELTLTARGAASGHTATAAFRVTTTFNAGGGPAALSNGSYRVTATREGLVGETTSTGHVIVPNDRFVALPACLASNCPWLKAGKDDPIWGIRTECGDKCAVKVVNPTNGSCAVAPVWDVGPWFRSDDWWRPTDQRRLNTKLGSPNTLAQGYPATEAARDGLDVGYGVGPGGHGASDRYADVGNRAAIDLADGTWNDLGLDFERGIASGIDVQLLWQTGQAPAEAARGCATVSGSARSVSGATRLAFAQPATPDVEMVAPGGQAERGKLGADGLFAGHAARIADPVAPREPGRFDWRRACIRVSSSRSMALPSPSRRWTRRGGWPR